MRTSTTRRADAARNIAKIIEAATDLVRRGGDLSMSEVARLAGVGRVTLYGHFPSREALLDAVLDHGVAEAGRAIEAAQVDGDRPDEALLRLARSSWQVLNRYRGVRATATRMVDAEHLRRRHDPMLARVDQLIGRGRRDGVIRADLPAGWLVTAFYSLLHAAADDADAGRLSEEDVPGVLEATLRSVLTPPAAKRR
jgi:AcrR family transcriptional regulator